MSNLCSFRFAAASLVLLTAAGCGSDHPPVYSVTGKVTYQGKPVEGAEIVFVPQGEKQTTSAHGTTDAAGKYAVKTFFSAEQEVKGAQPGQYKVVITKIEVNAGIVDPYVQGGAQIPKHLTPKVYSDAKTTPLTASVETKSNTHDFDLQDGK
jgi:hypothetical protein